MTMRPMAKYLPTKTARRAALGMAVLVLAPACQDLNVPNTNATSIEEAFNTETNIETAVGSAFKTWFAAVHGDDVRQNVTHRPAVGLSGMAGELTAGGTLGQFDEVAGEPRTEYNNVDAGQWFNRLTYQQLYASIALATDVLRVLDAGRTLGPVDATWPQGRNTARARIWAKFIQGLAHLYLGLYFDKALLVDEKVETDIWSTDFRPYPEVIAHGIAQLEEAIAIASQAQNLNDNITSPTNWVNGRAYTNADVVKLANSFIARGLIYGIRTQQERDAIDWNRVLTYLDRGITAPGFSYSTGARRGFIQQADPNIDGTRSYYVDAAQRQSDSRVSNYLLGPADTTGRYQTWLQTPLATRAAFIIGTPDRRIHGTTGTNPATSSGTLFRYLPNQTMSFTRGTHLHSNYRSIKYGTVQDSATRGLLSTMTPEEMNFIRAEALIELGRPDEALPFINPSRVAAGLPAVTVAGPPPTASCVPRKNNGACGDLWDAFMYEKRIVTFATEATIPYADYRRWGRLLKGTMLHMPVPGRELQTLGLPDYSYGGSLPGSAPDPLTY
jgi:hypothetical protein